MRMQIDWFLHSDKQIKSALKGLGINSNTNLLNRRVSSKRIRSIFEGDSNEVSRIWAKIKTTYKSARLSGIEDLCA